MQTNNPQSYENSSPSTRPTKEQLLLKLDGVETWLDREDKLTIFTIDALLGLVKVTRVLVEENDQLKRKLSEHVFTPRGGW